MSSKLIAAALVVLAAPALAQQDKTLESKPLDAPASMKTHSDRVLASEPETFVAYFEESGMPARLTEDTVGDPLVEYRSNGDKMSLFFYDCEDNVDCQAVQFYAGYRAGNVSLETINSWNTDRRFVRSYLTDEGVARIEMDVATSQDGLSYRDFDALLDLWLDSVVLFEDHINW
ncbi:MAG: YbjN domain-containing protein [Pseudomonadota bacterium]|nr:YbjN domain-containing protein [Pseudomonadota bacterium]